VEADALTTSRSRMLSREHCQDLYHKHAPGAFRRAQRMLGNTADADDVVHDVFLALFEAHGSFRGDSSVSTYLYSAVTHACLNRMRNQRKRRDLAARQWSTEQFDPGNAAEAAAMLRDLLARLPEPLCEVAVYHFLDQLPQREIASLIGCSHTHVGALVTRLQHWVSLQEVASCRA
jgi:RNA polymerase sigma factor (sigma-70 family)